MPALAQTLPPQLHGARLQRSRVRPRRVRRTGVRAVEEPADVARGVAQEHLLQATLLRPRRTREDHQRPLSAAPLN